MHVSVKLPDPDNTSGTRILLASAFWLWANVTMATGFEISDAGVTLINNFYTVEARAQFEFTERTLEALANGVGLTINIEVELQRQRKYFWDPVIVRAIHGYRLKRYELTEQYLITNTTLGTHRNFRSLDDAIHALGVLDPITVMQTGLLDSAHSHGLRLRSRLDIESLPAPLRLVAYISRNWRLSSPWFALTLP